MTRQPVRAACAAGLFLLAAAGPARAAGLDDYLGHGYLVVGQTTVPGVFTGCRGGLQVTMADGSRFTCTGGGTQASVDPRVYVLAQPGSPPSVILIGSRSYAGRLRQLGRYLFLTPAAISETDPSRTALLPDARDAAPNGRLGPLQSLNALQAEAGRPLNDAQASPLPQLGPVLPPKPPVPPKPPIPPQPR